MADNGRQRKDEARERARIRREQERRRERRRQLLLYGGIVVAVLVVAGLVVGIGIATKKKDKNVTAPAPASVSSAVSAVPAANFDTVGEGSSAGGIKAVTGQPALTNAGKPEVLYIGAEFCPYCAAERWALATALSRFGTLSGLDITRSGSNDGNYATLSFVHAKYTSDYISFVGKEAQDRVGGKLQSLTDAETVLASTLGPTKGTINYPFLDFGNKYVLSGSQFQPSVLGSLTAEQIAAQIANPSTSIGKAVLGSANNSTAAICSLTGNKPANVCTSSGVAAAAKKLNSGTSTGSSS